MSATPASRFSTSSGMHHIEWLPPAEGCTPPQFTEIAMPASLPGSALIIGASRGLGLALAQEYLERGWRVVGTVRGRAALHDLADRFAGRLEVETLDVVKPETNAVSQTADARKCITTGSRPSLTTAREFSTYAAGFGERPFLCAPALPRV